MLFEIRIRPERRKRSGAWTALPPPAASRATLLNCEKLHPFGQWYRVTAVYDGKMLHNYVGDELQGEGELNLPPERPGRSSVGTRIDLRDYYKGAMYEARFTRRPGRRRPISSNCPPRSDVLRVRTPSMPHSLRHERQVGHRMPGSSLNRSA